MENVDSLIRWVLMMVNGQTYALPLAAVDRILRMVEVTPLPGAPDVVEGVINIQGEVVPVVSIRRRLGLAMRPLEISDSLVMAYARNRRPAVIAESVLGVVERSSDAHTDCATRNTCGSRSSLACSQRSKMTKNYPLTLQKTKKNQSPRFRGLDQIAMRFVWFLVQACALFLVAGIAQLSAQTRPDAGSTLETLKPAAQPPQSPLPPIGVPEAPRPPLTAPDVRVQVSAFRFSGNAVFSTTELSTLVAQFVGKELDFAGLNQATAIITGYYRSHGYVVAQAYLPEQDIRDGVVEIAVLEGRLGQIRINQAPQSRLRPTVAEGVLAPLASGTLIEERALERRLLLLNDLAGVQAQAALEPGRNVGEADVIVEVADAGPRVRGSLEADNFGSRYTGEVRTGASLRVISPLGLGDQLVFRGLASTSGGLQYGVLGYDVPIGADGWRAGISYSALDYKLRKDFAPLNANGEAQIWTASLAYPLIRTRLSNLTLQLAYDDKRLIDRVDAVASLTDKKLEVLRLTASGDASDARGGGGYTSYGVTVSSGQLSFRNDAAALIDQAGHNTAGDYSKLNYSVARLQRLGSTFSLYLSLNGQFASKNLDSSEKFSLGGPFGVRAYPLGEAGGDEAHLGTVELRANTGRFMGADTQVFGFADAGTATFNSDPLSTDNPNRRTISGYGVGISFVQAGGFWLRSSLAWRGSGGQPVADVDRSPRFWVQAGIQY